MLDFKKIDEFLAVLEKATDDDELRKIFKTYSAKYDLDVPVDPYSEAYRKKQFDLYERLAKKNINPRMRCLNLMLRLHRFHHFRTATGHAIRLATS